MTTRMIRTLTDWLGVDVIPCHVRLRRDAVPPAAADPIGHPARPAARHPRPAGRPYALRRATIPQAPAVRP